MKKKLVLFASVAIALASCQTTPKEDYSWIKKGLDVASAQLQLTAEEIDGTGKLPRSIRTGYDMDFLCRQLERDPSRIHFVRNLLPNKWANVVYV